MSWGFLKVLGFSKCLRSTKNPGFLDVLGFFDGFLHENTGFLVIHGLILKEEGTMDNHVAMLLSPSRQDEI